ncbi:hypothetical protein SLITO_v1c08620 [Spiroplasma litorale]|uniref:Uncharacterized protein n=1 Tax=Spiroplasma litorale TaxID=216942 RepID=A0A0K1W308_9MOLU|nr:hypothetical protein [Spiroplasma litorale]AKX34477.1 hypothetical protein SLITO_v1c08620 [Spiroplasma litorale]
MEYKLKCKNCKKDICYNPNNVWMHKYVEKHFCSYKCYSEYSD